MNATSVALRGIVAGVAAGAALLSASAYADQPAAIPRIGVLVPTPANSLYEAGLRDALRELGYVEGKSIVIEWRRSSGASDELRSFATDLTRSKPDVIVAYGTPAARAALAVTNSIPVVFWSGDPVGGGIAASLAHPGANGTGLSSVASELMAKRVELLKQLVPRARRFVYLMNSSNPVSGPQLGEAQKAARKLGVQLVMVDARNETELDTALRGLLRSAADGILISGETLYVVHRAKIAQAVRAARLPAIFTVTEYHDAGVLMSYGPNLKEVASKMAVYVDKILKGAKSAELPVEQMSKYELVVDLRVARELDIKVPQELLLRADEVIR